jgi:hypothetical protein
LRRRRQRGGDKSGEGKEGQRAVQTRIWHRVL